MKNYINYGYKKLVKHVQFIHTIQKIHPHNFKTHSMIIYFDYRCLHIHTPNCEILFFSIISIVTILCLVSDHIK